MKILLLLILFLVPAIVLAAGQTTAQAGDTAWMLMATGLVMMMTPA